MSRKVDGGAGAQSWSSETPVPPLGVAFPKTRIWPVELMACASTNNTPRPAEAALFRSVMPVCFVQMNA